VPFVKRIQIKPALVYKREWEGKLVKVRV